MTMTIGSPVTGARSRKVPVAVYGNRWCGISQMIRRALEHAGIEYAYVDLDDHPDAEWKLQRLARGALRTPVVYVDGEWLMEPSVAEVGAALRRHGGSPWP